MDIVVPEGQTRYFDPTHDDYAESFMAVALETFDDLKKLGLVHGDLDEAEALEAIREDRAAEDVAARVASDEAAPDCECGHDERADYGTRFQAAYQRVRRTQSRNLIRLMQPSFGERLFARHPAVLHTHGTLSRLLRGGPHIVVGVAALNNIDIAAAATFEVSAAVSYLGANKITIGANGRLRFFGSNVKVNCTELNGPPAFFLFPYVLLGLSKHLRMAEEE